MMKKTLEKILNTLEKCCEETHQNGKSESDESKSKSGNQEASTKQKLSEALSIDKRYIFDSSDEKTKEKTESVYNETIKEIKGKEDFRQRDELFSDDEKWYLICDEGGSKIDISLSYDKIKSIPCNVIFNNCNIDLYIDEPKGTKKDNAETIKNRLYFYNCTFEKSLNLKNIIFEKILTFNQCAFYNDLEIYQNQFLDHLVFINCLNEQNDKKIISLDLQDNEFKGYLFIKNCTIEKINLWKNKFKNRCYFVDSKFGYKDKDNQIKLNFSNTHFEDEVYFNNSEFYNYADFHECKFKDNTYFNNSHFKDYVDFCECEFDNIACFYGVTFEKTPNFSQAIFKGNLNVVNTNLNFTFCDLQEKIKQECNNFNKKNEQDEKPLGEIANDFRDSFRTFKNALIKDNNLLDASKFHKYELYCKELELKQNWNQRGKNVESMRDVEKNIWRIRDLVDFLLLGFYRKLCDHHTDFLKVFNNLILLISLYILFIFIGSFKFNLEKNSIQNLDTISDMFPYLTKVKQLVIDLSPIQQYYDYILISFIVV
ncbi:TPA: pentapeptide repeat-containing protein, partial [Campylobacter coli]|nr:pentapeptide repeat-containing protein [Campylobacter coli]